MQTKAAKSQAEKARKRIEAIRAAIADIELVCSGTLLTRMTECGKPNRHTT